MKNAKITVVSAVILLVSVSAFAADTPQEHYISKYAPIAVSEMYRTGVPASITLAQGLLESRYGQSALAVEGNNHFGIKCHDWTGKKQYADDDKKGECFRVYDDAETSFYDHSDFLRYRDRYKFLFENETTDYKAWAYGLKKAGYATDPSYPTKLIKLIEDYNLDRFDTMTLAQVERESGTVLNEDYQDETVNGSSNATEKNIRKIASKTKKVRKVSRTQKTDDSPDKSNTPAKRVRNRTSSVKVEEEIPESPLSLEEPKKLESRPSESYQFSLSRQMFSLNGVPFIYATEGETIASIAKSNDLFVKELLKFNDMSTAQEPKPGDIVYLQPKKKSTSRGLDKYIADEGGESIWAISQRFGVRLSELCKRNSLSKDYVLKEGDTIILR